MYVFSIVMIVASNILYHIAQKSTPDKINPFVSLTVTYLVAAALSVVALLFYKTDKGIVESLQSLNWTAFLLGISILGLEFGFLAAYRAGWNISVGSLVANIALAIALIPVGIMIYKEAFEVSKIFGAVLCIAGLILIRLT